MTHLPRTPPTSDDAGAPATTSDSLKRKRERDKLSQRRKRQRDQELSSNLMTRVHQLEKQLLDATLRNEDLEARLQQQQPQTNTFNHGNNPPFSPPDALGGTSHGGIGMSFDNMLDDGGFQHLPDSRSETIDGNIYQQPITTPTLKESSTLISNLSVERNHRRPLETYAEGQDNGSQCDNSLSSSQDVKMSTDELDNLLATPVWRRLPWLMSSPLTGVNVIIQTDSFGPVLKHLQNDATQSALCTPTPKVLDLLFGGSRNQLANMISEEVTPLLHRPPEKFALSWLLYLYTRWLVVPSPESFAMLPECLRPISCQILVEHPISLDLIVWPSLRKKLILNWASYQLDEVLALLSCTSRLKGTFNRQYIKRTNGGEPYVDETFHRKFMDMNEWGLLERFWNEYPELVEGLDQSILIKDEHSLPP